MDKYFTIINVFWQRSMAYRFTVFSYRIGEVVELVVLIIMWTAVFNSSPTIGGFTLKEMTTYLLIGNLFTAIVRNLLSEVVARDIKDGTLSMYLIQPMGYFSYILTKEIGRISVMTVMSMFSQIFVCIIFFKNIIFNTDLRYLAIIIAMLFLAFFTELLISFLVGLIAFWTSEVDGLYSSIDSLKKFFSGGYFPLSLLPKTFAQTSFILPFAYSFYVPTQLYLKKFDIQTGLKGVGIQLLWVLILLALIHIIWRRGMKKYEGVGI